jgi:hypothetical protein
VGWCVCSIFIYSRFSIQYHSIIVNLQRAMAAMKGGREPTIVASKRSLQMEDERDEKELKGVWFCSRNCNLLLQLDYI